MPIDVAEAAQNGQSRQHEQCRWRAIRHVSKKQTTPCLTFDLTEGLRKMRGKNYRKLFPKIGQPLGKFCAVAWWRLPIDQLESSGSCG